MKTDLMLVADQTLLHGSFRLIITTPCQVGGYFHFLMGQREIMDIITHNPAWLSVDNFDYVTVLWYLFSKALLD